MSAGWTELAPERFVGSDPRGGHSSLNTNTTGNVVLSFRTRPGLLGWITRFAQSWDANITPSFSLRINGAVVYGFNALTVQIAAIGTPDDLDTPIRVEQLSLVEVVVDVASLAPNSEDVGDFAAQFVLKYFNP